MLWFCLGAVFLLGAIVGSFLNLCILRLPLEKTPVWPRSRCQSCWQPIRWFDNLPLISYLVLAGRCRTCRARFSFRYFFIEVFTGACFAGLFYLVVVENVHQMSALAGEAGRLLAGRLPSPEAWVVFGHRAALVSLLIVATFCDFDYQEIPLSLTVPGTVLGLALSPLVPWPWPNVPDLAALPPKSWWLANTHPAVGVQLWPVWGPLPDWLPAGNWRLGLATGVAGALVGTLMMRAVRYLFSKGLGVEALGLGDADLMMMAGAFLGWQAVVMAFFIGVFAGLFFGIGQLVLKGDNALPFGPGLSAGVVLAMLGWHSVGPPFQVLFFNEVILLGLSGVSAILMLGASYLLRAIRPPAEPPAPGSAA
jgi:leader peptidase (prepilin peptidase) / N-methyltransferase